MHPKYAQTVHNLTNWCQHQTSVHGAVLLGSQVREAFPGDEWSDLDVLLLVDDPQLYVQQNAWLTFLGDAICTIIEETPLPWAQLTWQVKRVLFADQRTVDFSIMPYARLADVLNMNAEIHANGWQVIYDSQPNLITAAIQASLEGWQFALPQPPTAAQAQKAIDELLFHLVYAAKKIKRGELWVAVSCINQVISQRLLTLAEFYAALQAPPALRINYEGRFLEQRLSTPVLDKLSQCLAKYNAQDAIQTLQQIMDTGGWLANNIYYQLKIPFSAKQFDHIQQILEMMFSETKLPS